MLNAPFQARTRRRFGRDLLLLAAAGGLGDLARAAPDAPPPDAATLGRWIHDAEHLLRGKTSAAVMGMTIRKPTYERSYDLLVLSDDRTADGKVLIRMLGPALWRGNVTLKVGDRISFYDPRTGRITVMGASTLGDDWMGSHFTNDDLLRETDLARYYRDELLTSRAARDETGAPVVEHQLRLTPLPGAPVAWARVLYRLAVAGDGKVYPQRLDYFRRPDDAQPVRTLDYAGLQVLDGRKVPTRLTMSLTGRPDEFTRVDYRKLKFDLDFGPDQFSERSFR